MPQDGLIVGSRNQSGGVVGDPGARQGVPPPCDRGALPWRVENKVDDVPVPIDFEYIQCIAEEEGPAPVGCACAPTCGPACPCACQHPWGSLYSPDGCMVPLELGIDVEATLRECGPGCACAGACSPTQAHTPAPVHLCRLEGKGWGVVTDVDLQVGAFVCEYVGERVTTPEAGRRLAAYDVSLRPHALLVFREILPSRRAALRINIDATRRGNVAAFINHSCDGGNLVLLPLLRSGALAPSLRLYARRSIQAGTELTYSYGSPAGPGEGGAGACVCGTAACRGFLPRDLV